MYQFRANWLLSMTATHCSSCLRLRRFQPENFHPWKRKSCEPNQHFCTLWQVFCWCPDLLKAKLIRHWNPSFLWPFLAILRHPESKGCIGGSHVSNMFAPKVDVFTPNHWEKDMWHAKPALWAYWARSGLVFQQYSQPAPAWVNDIQLLCFQ